MDGSEHVGGLDAFLEHHGIKGQRWGVRRKNPSGGAPASEDHTRVAGLRTQRKTQGTKTLSNRELQDLITRLNLEQQVKRLDPTPKESVSNFLSGLLRDTGKQQATNFANEQLKKQLNNAMKK